MSGGHNRGVKYRRGGVGAGDDIVKAQSVVQEGYIGIKGGARWHLCGVALQACEAWRCRAVVGKESRYANDAPQTKESNGNKANTTPGAMDASPLPTPWSNAGAKKWHMLAATCRS